MRITLLHTAKLSPADTDAITRAIPGELESRAGFQRLHHVHDASPDAVAYLRQLLSFDVNPLPREFDPAQARLLVTDMDSTLINIECIDEIADFAGVKPQVSAITEAAMRGELNFEQSLTRRVALLAGLSTSALQRVYDERLRPNPGAEEMVSCLKLRGVKIALVSGGFTFFTDRLHQRLGLDFSRANVLEMSETQLSGRVLGGIVGAQAKERFLLELCEQLQIRPGQAAAMGDGANDLDMMARAGLSIAYRAKPKVKARASVVIDHGTLQNVCHLFAAD